MHPAAQSIIMPPVSEGNTPPLHANRSNAAILVEACCIWDALDPGLPEASLCEHPLAVCNRFRVPRPLLPVLTSAPSLMQDHTASTRGGLQAFRLQTWAGYMPGDGGYASEGYRKVLQSRAVEVSMWSWRRVTSQRKRVVYACACLAGSECIALAS